MFGFVRSPLLALLGLAAVAGAPSAQEWGISFKKSHRRGSVEVGYGSRSGAYLGASYGRGQSCRPAVRPHRPAPRVWVPGFWREVWVEPVYETIRQSCGTRVTVLVQKGYWRRVWEPGRYEVRSHGRY